MKKLILILIMALAIVSSVFAWDTWADYEMFCFRYGFEPSYEVFEYYAELPGQGYPIPNEMEILEELMSKSE